jgi:uncharacterized repeat protein (TIGR03803 family)
MYSAVAKSEERYCLNNPGVGSSFGSTKLASAACGALTLAALSALLLIAPASARAQTETVLYSFCARSGCTDGSNPRAGLVLDTSGNFYGTTDVGGANNLGTVFEVSPSGTETVLYSFCTQSGCTDGYHPLAGLVLDTKGNLYGTTFDGGAHDGGTVFEVSPSGTETVLYSFCSQSGCRDGYYPHADLVRDTKGNLYGTTQFRGAHGGGTVFEVSPSGTETVLYSFCAQSGCTDGYHPRAGLVLDTNGNLYGTTYDGGANGEGTVFEVSPSGTETVLHSFCAQSGCTDGSHPRADLILDTSGNLYGTTYDGGANGKGTVFEVSPSGIETVLHSFCAQSGCRDGSHPVAGLVLDATGNLYGTTYFGGKGRGTVFKVSPSGTETVLHNFIANGTDGYYPAAGLVLDTNGALYGTTLSGGAHGGGTVFQVVP